MRPLTSLSVVGLLAATVLGGCQLLPFLLGSGPEGIGGQLPDAGSPITLTSGHATITLSGPETLVVTLDLTDSGTFGPRVDERGAQFEFADEADDWLLTILIAAPQTGRPNPPIISVERYDHNGRWSVDDAACSTRLTLLSAAGVSGEAGCPGLEWDNGETPAGATPMQRPPAFDMKITFEATP